MTASLVHDTMVDVELPRLRTVVAPHRAFRWPGASRSARPLEAGGDQADLPGSVPIHHELSQSRIRPLELRLTGLRGSAPPERPWRRGSAGYEGRLDLIWLAERAPMCDGSWQQSVLPV